MSCPFTADQLVANEIQSARDPVSGPYVDRRWLTDPAWVEQQRARYAAQLVEMASMPGYQSPWEGIPNFPTWIDHVRGTNRFFMFVPPEILAIVKPKLTRPYRGADVQPEEVAVAMEAA